MNGVTSDWTVIGAERRDATAGGTLLSRILRARALDESFLDPRLGSLNDPSLIPDLDHAAAIILDRLRAGDPIVIYADYDVDGCTAGAILWRTLHAIAPDTPIQIYIPHRLDEGYGLNADAMQAFADSGARTVITVDCGITGHAEATLAKELGLELIITDHHHPPATIDDLPTAAAVVHPARPDSNAPFQELCGAGVAFKLAWRLATLASGGERASGPLRALLLDLLPLVALGTIADVVPLVGENRVLTRAGLARFAHTPFPGINAMIESCDLGGKHIGSGDVSFRVAPRLNASGRMEHANMAAELLTTDDEARAREIASHLDELNRSRQAMQRGIVDEACEMVRQRGMDQGDHPAIVLASADWHLGVIGIVCSRLVEEFSRPTILLATQGDLCRGSGRSVRGFSLLGGLEACAEHLDRFGGHEMAAGLSLQTDRLDAFTESFTAHCAQSLTPDRLRPTIDVDCIATLSDLSVPAVGQLDALEPFGRDNPPVSVLIEGATISGWPKVMGAHGKHLAMTIRGGGPGGRMMRVVAWNWGDRAESLCDGASVDLVVRPKISTFGPAPTVEPELVDLRVR